MRVSAYDRTTSLLIALLLIVGMATFGVVVVYFSSRLQRQPPAIPVTPINPPSESRAASAGEISEETPGLENAPDALEPDLETILEQVSLAATSDAVLMSEAASADSSAVSAGEAGSDSRGVGDAGDGDASSRDPRREILFEPESLDQYAAWFDAAGLEIGVLGADNRVYYASKVSQAQPVVREGDPADEKRLYFNSMGGPLYALDRKLAEKAGILDRGAIVLEFCTARTQALLLRLEQEAAGGRPTRDIALTVFRVVKQGGDFAFEVAQQEFYR